MEEREHTGYHMEDSDEFGLPETDFHPVDREEEEAIPPELAEPRYYVEEEEETRNKGLIIAAIIGCIVVVGLVVYLFVFDGTQQIAALFGDDEPVQEEIVFTTPEPEVYEEPEPVYEEPVVVEETPTIASYQGIESLSAPTGRTFVVVASFVDYDLAMDYAQKLEAQGVGSKILGPTNRAPLIHRVAVADFETFTQGMDNIDMYRTNYGENAWILKY